MDTIIARIYHFKPAQHMLGEDVVVGQVAPSVNVCNLGL